MMAFYILYLCVQPRGWHHCIGLAWEGSWARMGRREGRGEGGVTAEEGGLCWCCFSEPMESRHYCCLRSCSLPHGQLIYMYMNSIITYYIKCSRKHYIDGTFSNACLIVNCSLCVQVC